MMRFRKHLLLCLIALLLALPGMTAMADGASLALFARTTELLVGSEVVVELAAEQVTNLYGIEVVIIYDPVKLEVVDSDPDQDGVQVELLDSFTKPDFVVQNHAIDGTVAIAFTQLAPSPAANGNGTIAKVLFRCKEAGQATIGISEALLADDSAQPIPASLGSLELNISAAAAEAEPSPTSSAAVDEVPTPLQAGASPEAREAAPTPTLPVAGTAFSSSSDATATVVVTVQSTATAVTPPPTATATAVPVAGQAVSATQETASPSPEPTITPATTPPPTTESVVATSTVLVPPTPVPVQAQATPTMVVTEIPTSTALPPTVASTQPPVTARDPMPTLTFTPVKVVMADVATPAAARQAAQPALAVTPVVPGNGSIFGSVWFIIGVVAVIIAGFGAVVIIPRERRRR